MRRSMRLARPVYELLPFVYMAVGLLAIGVAYLDPPGPGTALALCIAMAAEVAALTILLRRQDYRASRRDYSYAAFEFGSTENG